MSCCYSNPELPLDYDDIAGVTRERHASSFEDHDEDGNGGSAGGSGSILNTPYSNVTPLFRAIEKEDWESILFFLTTSKWTDSFFASAYSHMREPAPAIQCQTWVTSYDSKGREEWSQLPLHAAISYQAPSVVIAKLIELYPPAVRQRDAEGMLPIHLAFGFGSNDTILSLLLTEWPASVEERGPADRLPYECCELGPNKQRGEVFQIVAAETAAAVAAEHDMAWRNFVKIVMKKLELDDTDEKSMDDKQLTEVLLELLEDRKQLRDLKTRLKSRFGGSATSTKRVSTQSPRRPAPTVTPASHAVSTVGAVLPSPAASASTKPPLPQNLNYQSHTTLPPRGQMTATTKLSPTMTKTTPQQHHKNNGFHHRPAAGTTATSEIPYVLSIKSTLQSAKTESKVVSTNSMPTANTFENKSHTGINSIRSPRSASAASQKQPKRGYRWSRIGGGKNQKKPVE